VTAAVDGLHVVEMKGVDMAGNVQLNTSVAHWVLDRTAPTVELLGRDVLPPVVALNSSLELRIRRGDAAAPVWWSVNGSGQDSVWQEVPLQKSTLTVHNRGLGRHSLHLKSVDAVGNVFEGEDMWLWDVGLPPSVLQVRGPVDPSHSAKGVFSITCAATDVHTLRGTMCREVEYWVTVSSKADAACDGAGVETHRGTLPAGQELHLQRLQGGSNTLFVRAVDAVGLKQAVPSVFRWSVVLISMQSLDVTLTSTPAEVTAATEATFTFHAAVSDGSATFEVRYVGTANAISSTAHAHVHVHAHVHPHTVIHRYELHLQLTRTAYTYTDTHTHPRAHTGTGAWGSGPPTASRVMLRWA
jgi:hypothetical protein